MSELLQNPLIMTVREFRKVTGKETDHFTDEQIAEFITQLDFMAEMFIKRAKAVKEQSPMKQS